MASLKTILRTAKLDLSWALMLLLLVDDQVYTLISLTQITCHGPAQKLSGPYAQKWDKLGTIVETLHHDHDMVARGDQSGMDLEGIRRPDASGASCLGAAQPL